MSPLIRQIGTDIEHSADPTGHRGIQHTFKFQNQLKMLVCYVIEIQFFEETAKIIKSYASQHILGIFVNCFSLDILHE